MNLKITVLLSALILFAICLDSSIQVHVRLESQSDYDKKAISRRDLYTNQGLKDLSKSPFDTVFIKKSNSWEGGPKDQFDEPENIAKTVIIGTVLTFSLPAQMAMFLAGHLQVKSDMNDFSNLNQKMKEKYDQRFKQIDEDAINTNKWTTWTQGRERMQVLDEFINDCSDFGQSITDTFQSGINTITRKFQDMFKSLLNQYFGEDKPDQQKQIQKKDEIQNVNGTQEKNIQINQTNQSEPTKDVFNKQVFYDQTVQILNDFSQAAHRVANICKRIPQMLCETGNFWTSMMFHSSKEKEKEKGTYDDSQTIGNQFGKDEKQTEQQSDYQREEEEKQDKKNKQLITLYVVTTLILLILIIMTCCFCNSRRPCWGWVCIFGILITIFISSMIYYDIVINYE